MTFLNQPDYERYAKFYDTFELAGHSESKEINYFLRALFSINGIKTVADLACGTGAQSLGLAKSGYKVTACDLNSEMVELAKSKAGKIKNIVFKCGDMRYDNYGSFDATISIFNAIGHLSRQDFRKFLKNSKNQLNENGLLIFDILNYESMATSLFDEYKYMKKEALIDDSFVCHIRNCELDKRKKQIKIQSVVHVQDGINPPEKWVEEWEMQIYTSSQIVTLLEKAGFREIQLFGQNGTPFEKDKSDSILAVAQK